MIIKIYKSNIHKARNYNKNMECSYTRIRHKNKLDNKPVTRTTTVSGSLSGSNTSALVKALKKLMSKTVNRCFMTIPPCFISYDRYLPKARIRQIKIY
ncbi:MAG: hypothetical protein A2Z20_08680 [Bdellovibrionales bacterium RBG_16_40_8]|nr:MAG: hypothetical protein A2Z20_08680 [Bdellovibrionales bacterium RBG_16_40_8]